MTERIILQIIINHNFHVKGNGKLRKNKRMFATKGEPSAWKRGAFANGLFAVLYFLSARYYTAVSTKQ